MTRHGGFAYAYEDESHKNGIQLRKVEHNSSSTPTPTTDSWWYDIIIMI
jgi:Amt family ammonium transporter